MTVKELIERLRVMPQDAIVLYQACSDSYELEDDEPSLFKMTVTRDKTGKPRYHSYNDKWIPKNAEDIEVIDVCHFPGN